MSTRNFDLLTTSALKINKGKLAQASAQDHGKAKEALTSAKKKRFSTDLDWYKMTTHNGERVTEGRSDEGADEMKKQRLIVYTVRMPLKHNGRKTLFFKINVGLYALDIGNISEHHGYHEALQARLATCSSRGSLCNPTRTTTAAATTAAAAHAHFTVALLEIVHLESLILE